MMADTKLPTGTSNTPPANTNILNGVGGGISAPFIRYPIGTSLLMAGILFVGLVAYPLLPVAPPGCWATAEELATANAAAAATKMSNGFILGLP